MYEKTNEIKEKEQQELELALRELQSMTDSENRVPVISASDLMEMTIEPREYVVRELLTHGLSMLGGAPKCGKSWFVLDLCVHVATGKPFLGFPVTKGTVWYQPGRYQRGSVLAPGYHHRRRTEESFLIHRRR